MEEGWWAVEVLQQQGSIPPPSVCTAGASDLASGRRAVVRVGASACLMYGCSPEPWWFLASGSAPLLLAGMVLGGARWLALRPVALRPVGLWWIWRLVLSLAVSGLREVQLAEAVGRASSSMEGSTAVVVGCRLAVGMCSNSG